MGRSRSKVALPSLFDDVPPMEIPRWQAGCRPMDDADAEKAWEDFVGKKSTRTTKGGHKVTNHLRAIAYPCPTCDALRGKQCRDEDGKAVLSHPARGPHSAPLAPFLKGVGGKSALVGRILEEFGDPTWRGRYFEPFLNTGAVYLSMRHSEAIVGDLNPYIAKTWKAVQATPEMVWDEICHLQKECGDVNKTVYTNLRAWLNLGLDDPKVTNPRIAALTIVLNKTCFNGLMRVNQKGEFNAAWGKKVTSMTSVTSKAALIKVADWMRDTKVYGLSAFDLLDKHQPGSGDRVYLDSPYDDNFNEYTKDRFSWADQQVLAAHARACAANGAHVVVSNADTPRIRDLYARHGFTIKEIMAPRRVNRDGDGRGDVQELLMSAGGPG